MKTLPKLLLALSAAALAGCNAAPLDYHSPQDIPRGPGMFSGADGGFVMRTNVTKDAPSSPAAKPALIDE